MIGKCCGDVAVSGTWQIQRLFQELHTRTGRWVLSIYGEAAVLYGGGDMCRVVGRLVRPPLRMGLVRPPLVWVMARFSYYNSMLVVMIIV
jgi:hypothetical protein